MPPAIHTVRPVDPSRSPLSASPLVIDPLVWRGRLESCAQEFCAEAVRLRQLVRDPAQTGLIGTGAHAIADCGDQLSDDLGRLLRAVRLVLDQCRSLAEQGRLR